LARLIAFGDSFTTGLNKPPQSRYHVKPYIEYIAEKLGYTLVNTAIDGNSNPAISTQIMNYTFNEGDLVFIAWSGLIRDYDWQPDNLGFQKADLLKRGHRIVEHCLVMSDYAIRATENYLTFNKVNFIMTSAFVEPEFVCEKWPNWISGTLLEMADGNIEVCQHPDAKGHEIISNYIMEKMNETGTFPLGRKVSPENN